jgi:hypothetical protein
VLSALCSVSHPHLQGKARVYLALSTVAKLGIQRWWTLPKVTQLASDEAKCYPSHTNLAHLMSGWQPGLPQQTPGPDCHLIVPIDVRGTEQGGVWGDWDTTVQWWDSNEVLGRGQSLGSGLSVSPGWNLDSKEHWADFQVPPSPLEVLAPSLPHSFLHSASGCPCHDPRWSCSPCHHLGLPLCVFWGRGVLAILGPQYRA